MRVHNPSFVGVEDDALVCLAQDGDNDAFAELIERHLPTCKRLAMSILRDKQNAEDEVQNACWKAFEHINQFNKDAKFSTWLSRIVVNQCLMRLRKERRARFLYLDDGVQGEEIATLDLPDESPTPEAALAQSEIGQILEQEIRRIPPLLRDVFVLRDVRELPMPDVAKQLGISVAAAKSRLLRARLELRGRLSKHTGRLGLATLTA
ncbi:MAG: sigma-70 family RNA polymerase sigma factor [Bryobacteraceae bacterium]|nr:sigma-70 family RNA polymerase sigma factor [Bryobacteraceae bacterium]